jgi:hypothetical protein
MAPASPDRQRQLRRRHRRERQAVVFGSMVAAMMVAALGATAVYTGVVDAPFSREFTTAEAADPGGRVGVTPCPPEGAEPVFYTEVEVEVLNGSGTPGLAGQTADELAGRGFVIAGTGNYPGSYPAIAQVRFGEAGLTAAYTLAAQIDGAQLVLDQREDASVDLVLGVEFRTLLEPSAVPISAEEPLTAPEGCIPLDEARAQALPAPVPADLQTEGEGEGDGEDAEDQAAPTAEG